MVIKLIGIDLDGTLFNRVKEISDENISAIKSATKNGVCVIPVTGRSLTNIPEAFTELDGVEYAVTTNGASAFRLSDSKCIYKRWMKAEKAVDIFNILDSYANAACCFISGESFMDESKRSVLDNMGWDAATAKYFAQYMKFVPDIKSFVKQNTDYVEKVTINLPYKNGVKAGAGPLKKQICELGGVTVVSGSPFNLEVTRDGVTKGAGLIWLADMLGIDMHSVMAIGDSGNDLDMLRNAGLAVAMENAEECVRREADFITLSNDENGVAYAIRKFVF